MSHDHFILDTVNLLAGSLARRIHFNTKLSTAAAWSHLDANFTKYQMKVSFEDTRALTPVFLEALEKYRIELCTKTQLPAEMKALLED